MPSGGRSGQARSIVRRFGEEHLLLRHPNRKGRVLEQQATSRLRIIGDLLRATSCASAAKATCQRSINIRGPSSAMASKASGSSQSPTPRLFKCTSPRSVTNYSVQSLVTINEWFRARVLCRVLLLCLVFIVYQTKLSKSSELLDLSELSASQQNQLWTQVDNWAVAVALANFCERPTSLEKRMLKIATRCITPSSIKKVLDRFRATMKNVEGNIWDCTDKNVQTFVEKTVAKANLLVNRAEDACRIGSIYHQLLPLLQ
jgi:hypothetical protein